MTVPRRAAGWVVFALAVGAGLCATWARIDGGLAAATNLSDPVPWGLWVALDLSCLGLAAGGFVVAAAAHVLGLRRLRPAARPAVLVAFLGYFCGTVAIAYDLGRPWTILHPVVLWNGRSVMFEVAWCVILYTTVLALELAPPVLERLRWPRALRAWRLALPVLAFLGTMLSLLHQSSLGAIYLLFPGSLHPLWYSPLLPLHFLLSAVGAGCAVVLLVADLAGRAAGRPFDESLRRSLLLFVGVVLASYGALRVADATWRGALAAASPATLVGASFLAEMLLGVAVPATAAFVPRLRRSRAGALLAAGSAAAGLALNRWNVTVAGLEGTRRAGYVPSWGEIAVAAMIAALAVGVFRTAVRRLPVFVREEAADRERP